MTKTTLFNQQRKSVTVDDTLFKQYEKYVDSAEKVSDRRQVANSFMWTIHAAFISGFGLTFASDANFKFLQILIGLQAIFLCLFWRQLILSYKRLNSTKFKVIQEIEKKLPVNLYSYEWEEVKTSGQSKYKTFSEIELSVPIIFLSFWGLAIFSLLLPELKQLLSMANSCIVN